MIFDHLVFPIFVMSKRHDKSIVSKALSARTYSTMQSHWELKVFSEHWFLTGIMLNLGTGMLVRKRWPCSDGIRTSCVVSVYILTCLCVIIVVIVIQRGGHVAGSVTYVAEVAFTFHTNRSVQGGSVICASKSRSIGRNIATACAWANMSCSYTNQ